MKSDADLIRACKLWDKVTEKMKKGEYDMPNTLQHGDRNKPYAGEDFPSLQCKIDGKVAELTVGSSPGHKVHVDLNEGKLEYYDTDDDPNEVVNDLLNDAGLKCEKSYDGVKCEKLSKENLQPVFKVLAMPTSMDFRLAHCKREQIDPYEVCQESCADQYIYYSDPAEDDEFCGDKYKKCLNPANWVEGDEEIMSEEEKKKICEDDYRECVEQEESSCVEDCVDNFDYNEYGGDSEDCKDDEKKFFKNGPKKEELTKWEAIIHPPQQQKLIGGMVY